MTQIIEIRNLSKKYLISHDSNRGYVTLVDTISRLTKQGIKRILHPFKSNSSKSRIEEFWALKNITLSIEEGDRVGIIGRNGAGKSTLLKILSRITLPTTGHVKIRGRLSSLLEVGTGFHPELTGRENIFLNGAILGMKKRELQKKFDEIVAYAEVEKFLDTPVKRYSSGMITRLGFAIAAHLDPDLLIVDEVLAVGDVTFQEKCLKKLNELGASGRTVLFVSHDVGSVLTLCNKGIYLEKGQIKMIGPIDSCINEYMRDCRSKSMHWEGNLGDEHIRFHRVTLKSEDSSREFFYQGEKAIVEVEYEVLKPSPDLVISIKVRNLRNQVLADSHTGDILDNLHPFMRPGKHRIVLNIDSGLFHEGEYLIGVDCVLLPSKVILREEILLKYLIYPLKKNTRYSQSNRSGIFLGNQWNLDLWNPSTLRDN